VLYNSGHRVNGSRLMSSDDVCHDLTLANVNRCTKFFHHKILKETCYVR